MLAARRRIIDQPMVPSILHPGRVVPDMLVARGGEIDAVLRANRLEEDLLQDIYARAEGVAEPVERGLWRGGFVPAGTDDYVGIATYPTGGQRDTRRHEVMHGYNEAARRGYDGLPFWSRVAGSAPPAISYPLDELLAQRAGGAKFMEIPWDKYAGSYAGMGQPGAARVAQGLHAAQKAGQFASDYAPYLAGAAVGTGLTAYALTREEEQERDRQALLSYMQSVKPQ